MVLDFKSVSLVREAGLEPASPLKARDFKSLVYTNFTTLALLWQIMPQLLPQNLYLVD